MNVNDVINIIAYTLDKEYPNIEIRKENILQDVVPPCFFIEEINTVYGTAIGDKNIKKFNLVIKYFPVKSESVLFELHEIADKLSYILNVMNFEGKTIRANNLESKIEEGVLEFMLEIKVKEINKREVGKFKNLEVDVNAK